MTSQTRENVKKKKKIRRRRRNIKFMRIFAAGIVLMVVLTAIGWVSVNLYQWGSTTWGTYMEIYDGYKQRRALRAASFDPRFDGYTNILMAGLDPGKEDTGQQVDTLLLISFRHSDGTMRIINIPRYTLVDIPGRPNKEALNSAYYYGGIPLTEQTVAKLTGMTVHHYIAIDTEALTELVDAVGGVDIYVDSDMDYDDPEGDLYIHITKGLHHMEGDMVQKYLRFSSDELGSIGRSKRQKSFIKAFYDRLREPEVMTQIPKLVDICQNRVSSSIEAFDTGHFTSLITKLDGKKPEIVTLPGMRANDGSGHWIYNQQQLTDLIDTWFPIEEAKD